MDHTVGRHLRFLAKQTLVKQKIDKKGNVVDTLFFFNPRPFGFRSCKLEHMAC